MSAKLTLWFGSALGAGVFLISKLGEGTAAAEWLNALSGGSFMMTPDGKKMLVPSGNGANIRKAGPGDGGDRVVTSPMLVSIEPREEWRQLLTDAWRIQRDWFYDFLIEPVPLRNQMRVKMPTFNFEEGQAAAIADYFAIRAHDEWPSQYAFWQVASLTPPAAPSVGKRQ